MKKESRDSISKIIYFDKETIKNILQERNRGSLTKKSEISEQTQVDAQIASGVSGEVNLGMPLTARLKVAFSGKIATKYLIQHDSATTITSTEISDFESIKSSFHKFEDVQVCDIENSSTFFRVAGGYLKMVGNNIEGVNVKEFKDVMESFEGYDVYKINDDSYVRFNNTAFVSNYKRNDLLTTKLTAFCVYVGEFSVKDFDFIQQLNKMQTLLSNANSTKTLGDHFPPEKNFNEPNDVLVKKESNIGDKKIKLYDVVYACVYQVQEE